MARAYLINVICFFIAVIPTTVGAKSYKDAEAVITLRNGLSCFSYPRDKEICKWHYYFGYLSVSEIGPYSRGKWEISISDPYEKKGLLEPDSVCTCIKYGVPNPGMKAKQVAEPLQFNTPYRVSISVLKPFKEGGNERWYASDFCLSRNAKGEKIIVGADWDYNADAPYCLKPGESPKRSIWQRLLRYLSR